MGIPQINFSWQSCHVNHLLKYLRMATLGCSVTRILLKIQWYRTLHIFVVESIRSSRPEVFCKKSVLRNFTKFTGKHLYQGLFFYKVADLRPATILKKRLWHRSLLFNFVKFLRTPLLQNTSGGCFEVSTDVKALKVSF